MNATGAAKPTTKELLDQAFVLHQAGHLERAQSLYRRALALDPNHVHALHSLGLVAHARGERQQAISLLRQVVALKSDEAVFHHSLGQALRADGHLPDAVESFKNSVTVDTKFAGGWQALAEIYLALNRRGDAVNAMGKMAELRQLAERHNQDGLERHRNGLRKEACEAFRAAIACNPKGAGFYHNLGSVLMELGELTEALLSLQQAALLAPKSAEPFVALGNLLFRKGDLQGARRAHEHARALNSEIPDSRFFLARRSEPTPGRGYVMGSITGSVSFGLTSKAPPRTSLFAEAFELHRAGNLDTAESSYRQLLQEQPNDANALHLLGVVLHQRGDHSTALTLIDRTITEIGSQAPPIADTIRRDCRLAEAYILRGTILLELERYADAIDSFRQAIKFGAYSTLLAQAWHGLGGTLAMNGQLTEALQAHDTWLSFNPNCIEARVNRALVLLKMGDFRRGWQEYEWRRQLPSWDGLPALGTPINRRGLEDIAGKSIALLSEQGLGDTLQFVRYLPLLYERGARVTLVCKRELTRLLARVPGVQAAYAADGPVPETDYQLHLLSLPLLFETTIQTIPSNIPYVTAEEAMVQEWSQRLGERRGLRVGLVWAGQRRLDKNIDRAARRNSFPPSTFAPLFDVPGIRFYSLQKPVAAENGANASITPIAEFPPDIDDLFDLAALIANLDLVISVDTSVAHLAGAMAKPVWLLSRFDGCWRWLTERSDSPWYPTMRIFRQPTHGDWSSVIAAVKGALEQFVNTPPLERALA